MGNSSVKFEFSGTGVKAIDRALRKLDPRAQKRSIQSALRAGLALYAREVRKQLPVDAGTISKNKRKGLSEVVNLKKSVTVQRYKRDRSGMTYWVGVKGWARRYAHVLEFGSAVRNIAARPIWRPTWDRMRGEVLKKTAEKLWQSIVKEIRKGN